MNKKELLRKQYHLQIFFVKKQNDDTYINDFTFVELPDDFHISQVNNITGEVYLSYETYNKYMSTLDILKIKKVFLFEKNAMWFSKLKEYFMTTPKTKKLGKRKQSDEYCHDCYFENYHYCEIKQDFIECQKCISKSDHWCHQRWTRYPARSCNCASYPNACDSHLCHLERKESIHSYCSRCDCDGRMCLCC